ANAPPKSLRKDHTDRPSGSSRRGKSLAAKKLSLNSNVFISEGIPDDVSDPDPLAFAGAPSHPPVDVAQSSQDVTVAKGPGSEYVSSPIKVLSPGSVYCPEWGVTNGSLLDTPAACQDLVDHNLEVRLETEAEMKRAAEDKNAELVRELEDIRAQFSGLQVSNERLSQQEEYNHHWKPERKMYQKHRRSTEIIMADRNWNGGALWYDIFETAPVEFEFVDVMHSRKPIDRTPPTWPWCSSIENCPSRLLFMGKEDRLDL
nr:hypothetical protein [Tanacetum cinerariifolium]